MTQQPVFVDEILAAAVARVETKLLAQLQGVNPDIQGIYFQHGHPVEIIENLQSMSLAAEKKGQRYPLVALFRDFPEAKGIDPGVWSQPTFNIIFATLTNPTYLTETRKQKNFKPILYPIVQEFFNQLEGKVLSGNKSENPYIQIDHYFWGRESIYGQNANIFTDWIDCIEIKNYKPKFYNNICP